MFFIKFVFFSCFCVTKSKPSSVHSNLKDNLISYLANTRQTQPGETESSEEQDIQNGNSLKIEWRPNTIKSNPSEGSQTTRYDSVSVQYQLPAVSFADDQNRQPPGDFVHLQNQLLVNNNAGTQKEFLNFKINEANESNLKDRKIENADVLLARNKASILNKAKKIEANLNMIKGNENVKFYKSLGMDKQHYQIDPVLNVLRSQPERNFRRRHSSSTADSTMSSSSSRELEDFKKEFHDLWLHKKFEALNQTRPRGDTVNMVAARPWGVPCGDPNQHDMPWGSCMLSVECEPEFRIYRGDNFCGRTQFVCCGLQLTTYDMYQGFDVSFDDKSLSTDSEEKKDRNMSSKEKRKRRRDRERRKRKKNRDARKRKIKRHIKKIVKAIRKILNKQYRNGTRQRKSKTKQIKKFVKDLKKQYRKDRQSVKDLHEEEIIKIDNSLQQRLTQIKAVNQDFVKNATFRDILLKGTITKKSARMLLDAYPELNEFLEARRSRGNARRAEGASDDYLEYDIEYGYVYY